LLFDLGYENKTLWSVRIDGSDLRPLIFDVRDCRVLVPR
jgi:hypothetical protein